MIEDMGFVRWDMDNFDCWKRTNPIRSRSEIKLSVFGKYHEWSGHKILHMKVGKHTSFALMVMPDVMFPEKISVGINTVIGYNTTILAHEYLIHEYRLGEVVIGDEVLIGANSTILPGLSIGNGAIVSAGTLVHKDVPEGAFVGGNPMKIIYTKEEMLDREQQTSL